MILWKVKILVSVNVKILGKYKYSSTKQKELKKMKVEVA